MPNNIHTKLLKIHSTLVAPKNQNNAFGNYKYRSLEDILKAVKPILHKVGMTLTISDEITQVADRVYVTATATLTDVDTGQAIETVASARESMDKKGMDSAQITGAASSYSRKYCLGGLFGISDMPDADSMDNSYYQSNLLIMEFGELNEHPAMEGKRKAIKDAWRDCSSDDDSEKVLNKMKLTIIKYEEDKEKA